MLLLIWRTVVITVLVFPGNLEEDLRRNLNPSPTPRQVAFRHTRRATPARFCCWCRRGSAARCAEGLRPSDQLL